MRVPHVYRFSQFAVCIALALIFAGGLVTSWQAGMAVPDWPLSFGSINPQGWWAELPVRLEHGHRLLAMFVGLVTGILCAWVWGNWRALAMAAVTAAIVPELFRITGASKELMMHARIWPAAIVFTIALLMRKGDRRLVQWTVLAAFACVCVQAVLGGLRVTRETAGAMEAAMALRITHGCVAQVFLCLLIATAAQLAPAWGSPRRYLGENLPLLRSLGWAVVAAVFLQLIAGAVMRHLGAGLAIHTFPHATAGGAWLPPEINIHTGSNFAHTRIGAVIVATLVVALGAAVLAFARHEPWLRRPGIVLLALVAVQVALGIVVVWHFKPRTLTTLHVVNGAAILGVSFLIALRASRLRAVEATAGRLEPAPARHPLPA